MTSLPTDLRVPVAQRPRAQEILALTDAFCRQHLDEECADVCRGLVGRLARKRPSPLSSGGTAGWAAGVVYAVARANFLFEPAQVSHVAADTIAAAFGVAKSTASAKATRIETSLGLDSLDASICLRAVVEAHPLAWLVSVDGLVVDARTLPPVLQRLAHEQGLVPFVPDETAAA